MSGCNQLVGSGVGLAVGADRGDGEAIEQRHRKRVAEEMLPKLRCGFAVGAALFAAFLWVDQSLDPDSLQRNLAVRAATVVGFLLLFASAHGPSAARRVEGLLYLGVGLGAASVTWLSVGIRFGELLAVGSLLLMVVVIGALTSTLRTALVAYTILLAVSATFAITFGASPLFLRLVPVFVLSGAGAGGLLAALTERLGRRATRLELELERLAKRDSLTGVYNRGAFLERLEQEHLRSLRSGRPLSLLLLDIDSFKNINDTFGHPIGDQVIRAVARTAGLVLREVDFVGRLGGEEFAIALPESDDRGALEVAERLRRAVAEAVVSAGGESVRFTVSIGVAATTAAEELEAVLVRGDAALYRAKLGGRNRVCAAECLAA